MTKEVTVHQERIMQASAARVFQAWCDPLDLPRWYVDGAEGDPREAKQVAWILGGEAEPLEVTRCEPDRRLVLTNIGEPPWRGAVVDVRLEPGAGGTRVVVEQYGFSEALRDFVPNVDAGWTCMLAILQEYLERHAGKARQQVQSSREFCPAGTPPEEAPDPAHVGPALASDTAIAAWAGEAPARVLATTERGAVVAFEGHPGVFTLMGVGAVSVVYATWEEDDLAAAQAKAEDLADRLLGHVRRR